MHSTLTSAPRRSPQQARAAQRRNRFLEVAAQLFGQRGYEAVAMTAIAEEAGASIGTLYDYFPDKRSMALAILAEYAEQADAHWTAVLGGAGATSNKEFANLFIEGIFTFVREHPAYLPLLSASVGYARSAEARLPLRRTIADALQRTNPSLAAEQAFLGAQVLVELIKGMLAVYKQVKTKDQETVVIDFKRLMLTYVTGMQSSPGSKLRP